MTLVADIQSKKASNTKVPRMKRGAPHLYIHWPFCKNKCHYCDFVAFQGHEGFETRYWRALHQEFADYEKHQTSSASLHTVYYGGGTPSLWPLSLFAQTANYIASSFTLLNDCEITLEANPGGITQEHMRVWSQGGVNRLSIGVQLLDDDLLKRLNRHQTAKQARELVFLASDYFPSLSVDLIIGLPGMTQRIWQDTINTVINWPIHHISLYFLMVHDQTPLGIKVKRGALRLPEEGALLGLYEFTWDLLHEHGFIQYETSNFARPGYESRHNKAYWHRAPYKGFGIGAASFDGTARYRNEKSLYSYSDYWLEGKYVAKNGRSSPFYEKLNRFQHLLEYSMLQLRLPEGIDLHHMVYLLSQHEQKVLMRNAQKLCEQGLIELTKDRITATRRGMLLEQEVILKLLPDH